MKRVLRVRSVTSRHWQSATNVQKVHCKLALKVSVVISLSLNLVLARLGWFFGLRMCWFGGLYFMSGFIFVSLLFQDTTVRCQMPPNAHYVKRVHTRIAKDSYCAMCVLLVKFASMNYYRLYVFIVRYIMFLPKNYLSFEFGKYCGVRYLSLLISAVANSIIGRGGGHIFMHSTINFF